MNNIVRAKSAPRFDLPRICLWIALTLALLGTVGNTAWAFASVDNGALLMSYVKAIALDVGMVALAATLAQRKRAGASTRWLWFVVGGFVLGSMYANYLHGQTHLVTLTANLADWRPVILSALLPLMLFALVEIVAHAPAERRAIRIEPPQSDALPVASAPTRIVEVAPVMLECPDCGEPAKSQNALNAHKRFCKMRQATQPVAVNGNGAH